MIVEPAVIWFYRWIEDPIPGPRNDTQGICVPHHGLAICSFSFCSVIRSSGSLCEELRQLWRYCEKAEQHWGIYRKSGFPVARISDSAADLLCHPRKISLFPWMFLSSLVYSCHSARRELHRALLLYSTRLYKQLGSPSTSITLIMIGRRAPIRNISFPFTF